MAVSLSCGYQADNFVALAANRVDDHQQCLIYQAYRSPSVLAVGFPTIEGLDSIRIQEHPGSLFEANLVFVQVRSRLTPVPLEFHEYGTTVVVTEQVTDYRERPIRHGEHSRTIILYSLILGPRVWGVKSKRLCDYLETQWVGRDGRSLDIMRVSSAWCGQKD